MGWPRRSIEARSRGALVSELRGLGGFVGCAPFELDCDVFCFPLLPGAAGGMVDGEPLMLALAIEPPSLLDPFNPPAEGAETMPANDRAGDFQ